MTLFSSLSLAMAVTIAITIPIGVTAASRVPLSESPNLTVRVYDYAGVPDKTLLRAFDETWKIYRKAGIEVRIVRCRVALTDPVLDASCSASPGPSVIQIRLLPERMASAARLDKRVFGFAMTATRPEYGVIGNVFYHRVERLAADLVYRGYHEGVVLGHVMAHELGHLLLGTGDHSKRGLMRISWNEAELFSAHTGELVLSPKQAGQMRRDVEGRVRAQWLKGVPLELRVGAPAADSRSPEI